MASADDLPNWKDIEKDKDFEYYVTAADSKTLLVAYFMSPKCPHCRRMTPEVEAVAAKYTAVLFLKVNVHKCTKMTSLYGVDYAPTTILLRDQMILTKVDGKDVEEVEKCVKRYHKSNSKDLVDYIDQKTFKCFSESAEITATDVLNGTVLLSKSGHKKSSNKVIKSGLRSWLIIHIPFLEPVTLEAIVIRGPTASGPRNVLVFVNQSTRNNPGDFKAFTNRTPSDHIKLDEMDLDGTQYEFHLESIEKNVNNLTLVVTDNQSKSGITRINYLAVIGKPS